MKSLENMIDVEVRLKEYLLRIGDLINIEGPLLTLFSDVRNKNLYLYDWVDDDKEANRFLIYAVPPQSVLDYLSKKITHRQLASHATNEQYYIADIRPREFSSYKLFRLKQFPHDFDDIETNLFDEQYCKDVERILLFVIGTLVQSTNDFTIDLKQYMVGQETMPRRLLGKIGGKDEQHFSNWELRPMPAKVKFSGSGGQIKGRIDTPRIYLNVKKWEILNHDRADNQLPESKGVELYREPRKGVYSL